MMLMSYNILKQQYEILKNEATNDVIIVLCAMNANGIC